MTSAQQQATLRGANCEVTFDYLTRQLYATDASHYRIEPEAVAFPRTVRQVSALMDAAVQACIPVTPRGAGTGLTGGALGEGLIIDFSRYFRQITDLDLERRSVRVGSGVILDQLNRFLRPHGFRFGPDVATSSRATLGGMIANNSSGSHTPYYGTTADHICELEIIMPDGCHMMVGAAHDTLRSQRELVADLVHFHSLEIAERFPPGLLKRRPGYALDRCVNAPYNLNHLLSGSEGTLAIIVSAELKICPIPEEKGLGLIFFSSVAEAMQATVELLDLQPAAIEHLDRALLDQTHGQLEFQAARDLLELDHKPFQSVLAVEFFHNVDDSLREMARRALGLRTLLVESADEANLVWSLRKAGLSLLTGCKGDAKPVTVIEDVAVRPQDLPAYVASLQGILARLELEASFYGHAGSGLLHVRPILDLHRPDDVQKFRSVAEEVSALVQQFKGSLAGEHGVGIVRSEFMPEQLGENLMEVMREIKSSFDPHNFLNPGKIIPDGRYTVDSNLRLNAESMAALPFEPVLAFAAKDESFTRNLEQCNGCGGCRKETPSMCPTFIVTGEELMSTRGRANTIRSLFRHSSGSHDSSPLLSDEFEQALGSCLGCKACTVECPSNVNMALLKAELLHARILHRGLTWRERLLSSVDTLGRAGCAVPALANAALHSWPVRIVLEKILDLDVRRGLPPFARQRFDRWFRNHQPENVASRGRVLLWDDTFTRYYEPHIGIAAVKVLEAAGFEVTITHERKCCSRPAFSQGNLEAAASFGRHNLAVLNADVEGMPIIFLEPSCYTMFTEDYFELKLAGVRRIANRCFLFEQFMDSLMTHEPDALKFKNKPGKVVIHAHCHVRSHMNPAFLGELAQRLPNKEVDLLDSGCCGMAGGFGMLKSKYELSLKVAEPLAQMVRSQPYGTAVVASGTSCRHQLLHTAGIRPRHMAELMADSLEH